MLVSLFAIPRAKATLYTLFVVAYEFGEMLMIGTLIIPTVPTT